MFLTLVSAAIIFVAAFLFWHFYFSVYETKTVLQPEKEYYSVNDTIEISVIPLNAIGKEILFRKIDFEVLIPEGRDCVEITSKNVKYILLLKKKGNVVFEVKNKYSLQNEIIRLKIKGENEDEK